MKWTKIGNRLHRQHVESDDGAVDATTGLAGQLVAHILRPAAGRGAQVDNHLPRNGSNSRFRRFSLSL